MNGQKHGWIGVDLDGTLAHYTGWAGPDKIGEPIPAMVKRVTAWLALGIEVRIFTARASAPVQVPPIQAWCLKHLGIVLPVTNVKDFSMIELWDDRCVRVGNNTGQPCCEKGQSTSAHDAARGNENAIRHVAYAEGYADGVAAVRYDRLHIPAVSW